MAHQKFRMYCTTNSKKIVTLALLLFISGAAFAQQKMSLSIEKAVEIGLVNSKSLHASEMKVQSSQAQISEVNAARLPSLSFLASYTRLSNVPPFDVTIPFSPTVTETFQISPVIVNNYNLQLSLKQPIFTGFQLESSKDIAEY